jgi:hypothetical protein
MSEKVAHVIVVGLSEEERRQLDQKTVEMLRYNDPGWQYQSHWCDTVEQAFKIAAKIKTIDIIYIGREEQGQSASQRAAYVHSLYSHVADLEKQPVVSFPYGKNTPQRHKLPVAIIALWKQRNKSP